MDAHTQQEIRTAFTAEYKKEAAKKVTGLPGWFQRAGDAFEKKIKFWEEQGSWKMPAAMLSASFLPFYILVGGFTVAPLLTFALIAGGIGVTVQGVRKTNAIANAALDRDMASGILPERYKNEILAPQIAALELKKSSLPASGAATASFSSAATPEPPIPPAPPAPGSNPGFYLGR